jgi:transposase-like protein
MHNKQSISIKRLQTIFSKAKDKKYRNELIVQCYDKGYSQHMMAKVLGISQQAVGGIIHRSRR